MNILELSSSMLWWRAEVVAWRWRRISGSLRLPVCLGEGYDLAACYLRARQDKKAVESPHAVFLNLTQGDHSAAAEFIQRFGLLEWEKPHIIGWREDRSIAATARYFQTHGTVPNLGAISPTKPLWLSLDDFWAKHARYAAVVRLWQALGKDVLSLRKAWLDVGDAAPRIALSGGSLFRVNAPGEEPVVTFAPGNELKEQMLALQRWSNKESADSLRQAATLLLNRELNEHAMLQIASWQQGADFTFVPVLDTPSLWSAMWLFFGYDITTRVGLRLCPHCGKAFYPPRSDRTCCTPRIQSLFSKRAWWDRHKKPILKQRRTGRAKPSKGGITR